MRRALALTLLLGACGQGNAPAAGPDDAAAAAAERKAVADVDAARAEAAQGQVEQKAGVSG